MHGHLTTTSLCNLHHTTRNSLPIPYLRQSCRLLRRGRGCGCEDVARGINRACNAKIGAMRRTPRWLLFLPLGMLLLAACTQSEPTQYDNLVRLMRDVGIEVSEVGEIQFHCLLVNPKIVMLRGGMVEIYEYPDDATASEAVVKISPSVFASALQVTNSRVLIEPYHHVYKGDNLLVRYVGDDDDVLTVLDSALGTQFAGDAGGFICAR